MPKSQGVDCNSFTVNLAKLEVSQNFLTDLVWVRGDHRERCTGFGRQFSYNHYVQKVNVGPWHYAAFTGCYVGGQWGQQAAHTRPVLFRLLGQVHEQLPCRATSACPDGGC